MDTQYVASNPGRLKLSKSKLKLLRPDLCGIGGGLKSLAAIFDSEGSETKYFKEHLKYGDSRAAIVVSTSPILVAAYTDELDCVAMLHFPDELNQFMPLKPGKRLLTVNVYSWSSLLDEDLQPGPRMTKRHCGFHPLIADFVSDDEETIVALKKRIPAEEWRRTQVMAEKYLNQHPGRYRDGSPARCQFPYVLPD